MNISIEVLCVDTKVPDAIILNYNRDCRQGVPDLWKLQSSVYNLDKEYAQQVIFAESIRSPKTFLVR